MSFFKRFVYAFEGIVYLIKKDRNFSLHLIFLGILILFGFYFQISINEWLSILICSALVLSLEAINSAIERFADHLHPERHEDIKIVKDVASGAVLIAAIFSFIIALLVFLPKIYSLLNF